LKKDKWPKVSKKRYKNERGARRHITTTIGRGIRSLRSEKGGGEKIAKKEGGLD